MIGEAVAERVQLIEQIFRKGLLKQDKDAVRMRQA
jgi:hypothetical protein